MNYCKAHQFPALSVDLAKLYYRSNLDAIVSLIVLKRDFQPCYSKHLFRVADFIFVKSFCLLLHLTFPKQVETLLPSLWWGLYFWLWFLLTGPQPHYCLLQIASFCLHLRMWAKRNIISLILLDSFISPYHLCPPVTSASTSQLMGSITLSFWRRRRKIYPEDQSLLVPRPDEYNESAGFASPTLPCFAYLHSSLFTAASLNLSGEKFTVLRSNFDLVQT